MEVHDFSLLEDSDGEFLELGGSSSIDNSCNYDYLGYDLGRGWSQMWLRVTLFVGAFSVVGDSETSLHSTGEDHKPSLPLLRF
jgi:hypothetical protein